MLKKVKPCKKIYKPKRNRLNVFSEYYEDLIIKTKKVEKDHKKLNEEEYFGRNRNDTKR